MKKNVLFVVDERQMGGVSIVLENILSQLDYSLLNIDLLILHDSGNRLKKLPKEVRVLYGTSFFSAVDIPLKEAIRSFQLSKIYYKLRLILGMKTGKIKKRISKERKKILDKEYDVEIAFKDGFTALFTSCGNAKKKVHWLHYEYGEANPNRNYDVLFQDVMKAFDLFVAVSKNVLEAFEKEYDVDVEKKIIHNLIIFDNILTASKENLFKVPKHKLIFGSVGRMHEVKGYDRLIECIRKLKENSLTEGLYVYLIGDGPKKTKLMALVENYELNDIIKFMDSTDNPYYMLKEFDLFILPSYFESFGLVCLEALALGVPVLATETAGTKELFSIYNGGMLVENSTNGLYNGLYSLLRDTEKINTLRSDIEDISYLEKDKIKEIMEVLVGE